MAKRMRSPNYPTLSLPEAIERVQKVYRKEHTHPVEKVVVAQALGYGTLNGASMSVISALTKYGLLEQVGEQLRVSSSGQDVTEYAPSADEWQAAVRDAAFKPALWSELHDQYGERLPSDNAFRMHLLKKDFNPNTVAGVIRSYRDTIEFLNEHENGSNEELDDQVHEDEDEGESMQSRDQAKVHSETPLTSRDVALLFEQMSKAAQQGANPVLPGHSPAQDQPTLASEHPYSWPLPPGVRADITFRGTEPTSRHVAQLIGFLELFKEGLEQEERATPRATQPQPRIEQAEPTTDEAREPAA